MKFIEDIYYLKKNITKKEAINSLVIDRGSGAITLLILSIIFYQFYYF